MIASHARTLPMAMGYTVCSSMLMVTNKLALRVFPYPSLLMAVQFLVSASVVRGLSLLSVLDVEPLILGRVKAFWMVPLCFELAIFANIKLLEAASVETAVVFRTAVPLITAWADWAFMDREAPSTKSTMSLFTIVLGALLYAWSSPGGLMIRVWMWALLYLSILSFEMVYVKHVLNRLPMSTWTRVYYNNALALAFWPPFLFLGEEYQQLSTAAATISQSRAGFVVAMSCLLGVGISFTGFGLRSLVTATTFTVLGVMNKVLTILMSYLLVSNSATFFGITGLLACIGAGTMYEQAPARSLGQYQSKLRSGEGTEDAEATPLVVGSGM